MRALMVDDGDVILSFCERCASLHEMECVVMSFLE